MDSNTNQTKQAVRHQRNTNVDGFTRVSRGTAVKPNAANTKHAVRAPNPTASENLRSAVDRQAHTIGVTVVPHSTQRSKTLMRSAVKKPNLKSDTGIKAVGRTDLLAKIPVQTIAPKMSYHSIDPRRNARAERMLRSPAVSRYAEPHAATTQFVMAPAAQSNHEGQPRIRASTPARLPGSAMPSMSDMRSTGQVHTPVHAVTAVGSKHDIFEKALADASGHMNTFDDTRVKKRKKGGRALRLVTGSLALLFIAGFLAYQNASSLSFKIASYRAGVSATMPSQQPAGFTLGYLDYRPGNITANFTSPDDGRQFNITQKSSNWDSQALLSNFVTSANSAYKTYQRAGRTVYLIGNNTATWVDSGIWYTVDGNSSLSSKQILDLASSM